MSPQTLDKEWQPAEPAKRSRMLDTLYAAQEQYGYLSEEALRHVADQLSLSLQDTFSTASFYSLYHMQVGETTSDGKFTLETVQCLAACETSPAMRINDELYDNLTEAKVDAILDRLARG